MKHYILCLVALTFVLTNSGCAQKKLAVNDSMSNYKKHGITIPFNGSIKIVENTPEETKGYFYKSIEIIRFNEDQKTRSPNSQQLISETIPLDSIDLQPIQRLTDDNWDLQDDSIPSPIIRANSSLSNSFSYNHHLSSLYILPNISTIEFLEELKSYVKNHPPYTIVRKIENVEIGGKKVQKFRVQNGKTRLDHYVIYGKEYNYLFVSSPYGSNGVIEEVIAEMKLNHTKDK